MDLSDSSKLLKTFNLSKALEMLSCNEDTHAVDSIFSNSTSCEATNQYENEGSGIGESLFGGFEEEFEPDFFKKKKEKGKNDTEKRGGMRLKPGKNF